MFIKLKIYYFIQYCIIFVIILKIMALLLATLSGMGLTGLCIDRCIAHNHNDKIFAQQLYSSVTPLAVHMMSDDNNDQIVSHAVPYNWILYLDSMRKFTTYDPVIVRAGNSYMSTTYAREHDVYERIYSNEVLDKTFSSPYLKPGFLHNISIENKETGQVFNGNGTFISNYLNTLCNFRLGLGKDTQHTGTLYKVPAMQMYFYGKKTFDNHFEYSHATDKLPDLVNTLVSNNSMTPLYLMGSIFCGTFTLMAGIGLLANK